MAVLQEHLPYYDEIFRIDGFLQDPVLLFGFQEIQIPPPLPPSSIFKRLRTLLSHPTPIALLRNKYRNARATRHISKAVPVEFRADTLMALLRARGVREISALDLFDARADIRHDMNFPVDTQLHDRFGTLIDIGSIEHVFDSRQCLENCLRMVRPGGFYLLHTAVNGYFGHGLHVFNPEGLIKGLTANGFEIVYKKYSTRLGVPVSDPSIKEDVLIWIVARKLTRMETFIIPQQGLWDGYYSDVAGER